jgi:hypothetical protein
MQIGAEPRYKPVASGAAPGGVRRAEFKARTSVADGAALPELVSRHIRLRRAGAWWVGLCPFHADRNASFALSQRSGRWRYRCFACGVHGDTADWLQQMEGMGRVEALARAGVVPTAVGHSRASVPISALIAPSPSFGGPDDARTLDLARVIWTEAVDPTGTLVERYLASRRLWLLAGAPLRFHPRCPRGRERLPAMVALLTDPATGEPRGIHRTFVDTATGGKATGQAKMMLGGAGMVRLAADAEITLGLGLAEGIETALALMLHAGWTAMWATGSAGGIQAMPVLPGIECLTIFTDRDDKGAGMAAAQACRARWTDAGREARLFLPPDGQDWHDALVPAARP